MAHPDDPLDLEPTQDQIQTLLALGLSEAEIEDLTNSQAQELIETMLAASEPQNKARGMR